MLVTFGYILKPTLPASQSVPRPVSRDPLELGFVTSVNRPGSNVTGVNAMSLETVTKRLGLLHELLPGAERFAVLVNPNDPNAAHYTKDLQAAASAIQRQVEFFSASNNREIDVAFARLAPKRPDALLVVSQGLLINRRVQIVTQATRHGLPAIYPGRAFAEIGGLMSYWSERHGPVSSDRHLYRPRPQRRKAGRHADPAREPV